MARPEDRTTELLDERAGFGVALEPASAPANGAADAGMTRGRIPPATTEAKPGLKQIAADRSVQLRRAIREALVTELERGTPFLFVPVFLAVGALIYFGADVEPKLIV